MMECKNSEFTPCSIVQHSRLECKMVSDLGNEDFHESFYASIVSEKSIFPSWIFFHDRCYSFVLIMSELDKEDRICEFSLPYFLE